MVRNVFFCRETFKNTKKPFFSRKTIHFSRKRFSFFGIFFFLIWILYKKFQQKQGFCILRSKRNFLYRVQCDCSLRSRGIILLNWSYNLIFGHIIQKIRSLYPNSYSYSFSFSFFLFRLLTTVRRHGLLRCAVRVRYKVFARFARERSELLHVSKKYWEIHILFYNVKLSA